MKTLPMHSRSTGRALATLAASLPILAQYPVVRDVADGKDALPPDASNPSLRQRVPRVAQHRLPAALPPSPLKFNAEGRLPGGQQAQDFERLNTAIFLGPNALARAPSQELILGDGGHAIPVEYADALRGPRIDGDTDKIRA